MNIAYVMCSVHVTDMLRTCQVMIAKRMIAHGAEL